MERAFDAVASGNPDDMRAIQLAEGTSISFRPHRDGKPVVKIDGRTIGSGRPGRVTRQLVAAYHALTQVSGEPIYG